MALSNGAYPDGVYLGVLIFWCVALLLYGPYLLLRPKKIWRLVHALSFRNPAGVEPSRLAIGWYRFCGLLSIGIGLFLLGLLLRWWSVVGTLD